jgi:hypothetical protein
MVRGERVSVCVNRECEIASMEYEIVSTERGSAWYGLGKVGRGPLWSAKMKKNNNRGGDGDASVSSPEDEE